MLLGTVLLSSEEICFHYLFCKVAKQSGSEKAIVNWRFETSCDGNSVSYPPRAHRKGGSVSWIQSTCEFIHKELINSKVHLTSILNGWLEFHYQIVNLTQPWLLQFFLVLALCDKIDDHCCIPTEHCWRAGFFKS